MRSPSAVLLLLLSGALARSPSLHADEEAPRARRASALTATMEAVWQGDGGTLGESDFHLKVRLANPGATPITLRTSNLLARSEGGWLAPIDPVALPGHLFKTMPAVEPGKEAPPFHPTAPYKVCGSVKDAVLALEADDGEAVFCTALRAGSAPPSPCEPPPWPLAVGVMGPLEAVPYADGRRSVVVVGQVQALTRGVVADVAGSVLVGGDSGAGQAVEWTGGVGDGQGPALWPFLQRIDVPSDFAGGSVSLRVKATVDGEPVTAALEVPVHPREPFVCVGPVLGLWQLGNGPAERQVHANLLQLKSRYAWDLVIMVDGSTTRSGDLGSNEAYHAWNQTVYAAADGEVVDVVRDQPDRTGTQASTAPCLFAPANRVVLRHAGGVHTAYLHLKHDSVPVAVGAHVRAGERIGRVGNSGHSSEPHLHFFAYRRSETGVLQPVPVAFRNAFEDAQGKRPLTGVPVGGTSVQFLVKPR